MIVVAGATGNVGAAIVRELASAGHGVRALVRPGSAARIPAGAERAEADLNDRASLRATYDGVEATFLLAGRPGAHHQRPRLAQLPAHRPGRDAPS